MKLYRTFINGDWYGLRTPREITGLEKLMYSKAVEAQKQDPKDHRIYKHYEYNKNGELETCHFYIDVYKSDKDFEAVASMRNSLIGAIHRR